jgi:hypothetical protein
LKFPDDKDCRSGAVINFHSCVLYVDHP